MSDLEPIEEYITNVLLEDEDRADYKEALHDVMLFLQDMQDGKTSEYMQKFKDLV